MRRFALLAFTAITTFAASWDGAHGNITVSTIGDRNHTVFSVSDADQTVSLFSVVVTYQPAGAVFQQTVTQFIVRIPSKPPEPVLAVFDIPLAEVKGVLVSEFRAGQSEAFK